MHKEKRNSIFRLAQLPSIFSLMNLASGLVSIMFSTAGMFAHACVFIIVAAFFDSVDGRAARFLKKSSDFGRELDSLCDIISFGVAPAILAFQTTKDLSNGWLFIASSTVYILFVMAGALRLARFNITDMKHFEGMPITANAIIVPLFYFIGLSAWFPLVLLVSAILMFSTLRIKKIR